MKRDVRNRLEGAAIHAASPASLGSLLEISFEFSLASSHAGSFKTEELGLLGELLSSLSDRVGFHRQLFAESAELEVEALIGLSENRFGLLGGSDALLKHLELRSQLLARVEDTRLRRIRLS